MESVSKILKIIMYVFIAIAAMYLLVNILPWVLIIIVSIWAVYEIIKFFGKNKSTNIGNVKKNKEDNLTQNKDNIIDVEYEDVKQ